MQVTVDPERSTSHGDAFPALIVHNTTRTTTMFIIFSLLFICVKQHAMTILLATLLNNRTSAEKLSAGCITEHNHRNCPATAKGLNVIRCRKTSQKYNRVSSNHFRIRVQNFHGLQRKIFLEASFLYQYSNRFQQQSSKDTMARRYYIFPPKHKNGNVRTPAVRKKKKNTKKETGVDQSRR
jgi:hypothetical protein